MKINLSEIPEEGATYQFDRKSAELNTILADLVGSADYSVEFVIRPLNTRDFEVKGWLKTKLPEQCSRCGIDFAFPVDAKFHEFLIPKMDQPRGSRYSHVNHVSDLPENGPETTEYEDFTFDAGEYLHEVAALAAPFNVAGPENEDGDCSICDIPVRGRSFSYNEELPEEKPQSPFAALKGLKIN